MINKIMKQNGVKSFYKDLERMDFNKLDKNIIEEKDISYIEDKSSDHKLDVYFDKSSTKKPILIDLHGGGFITGDKEMDHLFGNYIAQQGYIFFNVNYRLAYPKYNVFDQINDVSNAVKWIINNADRYHGDINNMYIIGHSAAGVLAIAECMMCIDKNMRKDYDIEDRNYNYKGIILDCGAMNFYKKNIAYWGMRNMVFPKNYKINPKYKYLIFENNAELHKLPKTVIITNAKDELKKMSYNFKRLLDNINVDSYLIDGENGGHMGIIYQPYNKENQKILTKTLKILT